MNGKSFISLLLLGSWLWGCSEKNSDKKFQILDPDDSGITFSNTIIANDTFNVIDFYYIYNGGGVAAADFNRDGLQDVYFSGNTVANALYLNRGDFQFEDITETAGVAAEDIWSQGIAVADINHDEWPDIYVCASIYDTETKRKNKLYINQGLNEEGIPTFSEEAENWGIAENGHSSNAAFLDYDLDGDLDLFILNNFMDRLFPSQFRPAIVDGSSVNSDKLYRNTGKGHFEDVSEEAGILLEGYSHGISVRDINLDGWPDIYITNDFLPNDILYINNQDGTFTNSVSDYLRHQCFSAMGNDIADINNDGLQEIFALDMLPEMNYRKKTMLLRTKPTNQMNYELYNYDYQYIRNMLHLNGGPDGKGNMLYSDIGFLSGIFETDWSWSPLFADFDNDGYNDLVIANGFPGDVTDMDFANYMNRFQNYILKRSDVFDTIPEVKIDNYIFKNNGDLTFTKMTTEWGFEAKTYSNGAAFADFDNDGDLDYITNNINGAATLYKNNSSEKEIKKGRSNFLRIRLKGSQKNTQGLGAKVLLYAGHNIQFVEYSPYRGFMSSTDPVIHFGLGEKSRADSLIVFWPEGKKSSSYDLQANSEITVDIRDAEAGEITAFKNYLIKSHTDPVFRRVPTQKIPFVHEEKVLYDFNLQLTIPHKLSQYTPGIAVSDINGDGAEDLYIGGNGQSPGIFFIQNGDGNFNKENRIVVSDDLKAKDSGLLFFDADGDDDDDLYIVSGDIEQEPGHEVYKDRLYLNDGKGYFSYSEKALPELNYSGSCVKAADFDNDGDLDLFVGTRTSPGEYPFSDPSFILENKNGVFTDITAEVCPGLLNPKMISDAVWTDFNNDNLLDLIVVGEWMNITFYKNENGMLKDVSASALPKNSSGWWNCISGSDIDNDGDTDYICGNLGLNSIYGGNEKHPLSIYADDYDLNGIVDPVVVKYISDKNFDLQAFPVTTRDDLIMQISILRQRTQTYRGFGESTIDQLFTKEELDSGYHKEAVFFESSVLLNDGNGNFKIIPLPKEAQTAPVFGIITQDFNTDGNPDILLAGNDYAMDMMSGRIDAGNGWVLLGNGDGTFKNIKNYETGFLVNGDVKGLAVLFDKFGHELILTTQNKDSLVIHEYTKIPDTIDPGNARYAEITLSDGKIRKHEFYLGTSFLSQSSDKMIVEDYYDKIKLFDYKGDAEEIQIPD